MFNIIDVGDIKEKGEMVMRFDVIDIAGIKEATDERIIEVEQEAIRRRNEIVKKELPTNDDVSFYKWYDQVAFKCDYELKQRGTREKTEWELMFD